jgi:hypothetical protein
VNLSLHRASALIDFALMRRAFDELSSSHVPVVQSLIAQRRAARLRIEFVLPDGCASFRMTVGQPCARLGCAEIFRAWAFSPHARGDSDHSATRNEVAGVDIRRADIRAGIARARSAARCVGATRARRASRARPVRPSDDRFSPGRAAPQSKVRAVPPPWGPQGYAPTVLDLPHAGKSALGPIHAVQSHTDAGALRYLPHDEHIPGSPSRARQRDTGHLRSVPQQLECGRQERAPYGDQRVVRPLP